MTGDDARQTGAAERELANVELVCIPISVLGELRSSGRPARLLAPGRAMP
jgi:hypothetical protein